MRDCYKYERKYAWIWCNFNEWEIAINMFLMLEHDATLMNKRLL